MPENYHGNQLKSYGGYLRYTVNHGNRAYEVPGPDVVLSVSFQLILFNLFINYIDYHSRETIIFSYIKVDKPQKVLGMKIELLDFLKANGLSRQIILPKN